MSSFNNFNHACPEVSYVCESGGELGQILCRSYDYFGYVTVYFNYLNFKRPFKLLISDYYLAVLEGCRSSVERMQ